VLSALRGALRHDVMAALPAIHAAQAAPRAAMVPNSEAWAQAQPGFIDFLLDPGALCCMPSPAMDAALRLAAGFLTLAAALWLGVRPDAVGVSTLLLPKKPILCAAARVDTCDAPGLPGPGSPNTGLQPQAQRNRRRVAQVGSDARLGPGCSIAGYKRGRVSVHPGSDLPACGMSQKRITSFWTAAGPVSGTSAVASAPVAHEDREGAGECVAAVTGVASGGSSVADVAVGAVSPVPSCSSSDGAHMCAGARAANAPGDSMGVVVCGVSDGNLIYSDSDVYRKSRMPNDKLWDLHAPKSRAFETSKGHFETSFTQSSDL
jgi:hypothetical protein